MTIEGASAPSLDNWHMPRHLTWRGAVEPRIIRHLDLSPERTKTRTLVEGQRGRVIEGAGVQPDAFDRPRPRDVKHGSSASGRRPFRPVLPSRRTCRFRTGQTR